MEELINSRVKDIHKSIIREVSNKASLYPDAINLSVGEPDFFTPEHIKEYAKEAIDKNKTKYTINSGITELKEAASNFFNTKYNLKYNPKTEVIVTNGATEALDITFRTILDKDSEVLIPAPCYVGYEPLINLCGGKVIYLDTSSNGFMVSADIIEKHLTPKTRCIVLSYPSNPTGRVISKKNLEEIADLLKDKNIFILNDEIYSELIFSGNHNSIATLAEMKEKSIVINGVSKSHSMTGWRIGFVLAPEYLAKEIFKVHQYSTTCSCSISQYAALEALTVGINDANAMKLEYRKRRDFIYNELRLMGFEIIKPEGTFYLFPSIKNFNITSMEFSEMLFNEEHVAVVPGIAFSKYGEGYIRISYASSMENLKEAMKRIKNFIFKINRKCINIE